MSLIVGVQFSRNGKLYYFDPAGFDLKVGDAVQVNTRHGNDIGTVVLGPSEVEDTGIASPLKKILGLAEKPPKPPQRPRKKDADTARREKEAFGICEEKIRRRGLPMKLIDVEMAPEVGKIIFYFAADGRIDFRELVKDLAAVFRTRIELRQIGVRDEAQKIGGLGPCGRPCCCNEFLHEFAPVSIKMAKEQNLSLSPAKISGLCGRLMCCLSFENEHYHEMSRKMPGKGCWVRTEDGPAEVCGTNILTGEIRGKIGLPDGSAEIRTYDVEEVKRISAPKQTPWASDGDTDHGRHGRCRHTEQRSAKASVAEADERHGKDADSTTEAQKPKAAGEAKKGGRKQDARKRQRRRKPQGQRSGASAGQQAQG